MGVLRLHFRARRGSRWPGGLLFFETLVKRPTAPVSGGCGSSIAPPRSGHGARSGCALLSNASFRRVSALRLTSALQGTYGVVFKAKDKQVSLPAAPAAPQRPRVTLVSHAPVQTGRIVALKKIILQNDDEGVPATSIREIALLKEVSQHRNIVQLLEVINEVRLVVGWGRCWWWFVHLCIAVLT